MCFSTGSITARREPNDACERNSYRSGAAQVGGGGGGEGGESLTRNDSFQSTQWTRLLEQYWRTQAYPTYLKLHHNAA